MTEMTVPLRVGMQDLTYDQRAVWGTCPVCRAPHGDRCRPSSEAETHHWTHSPRLELAPARIRIEALG